MKRAMLCIVALLFAGTSAHAQTAAPSVTGTWQGTLTFGQVSTRVTFTIEKKADGSLHGGYFYIDNNDAGFPLSSITFTPPDITLTQDLGGMTLHGQLSADGKSITGTWAQGARTLPITLSRATSDTLWKPVGPAPLPAMAADADPSFEVATIKPCEPVQHGVYFNLTARPVTANDVSATELIKIAYNVRGRQVIGGPPWMNQDTFDVIGMPDTLGKPSEAQGRTMIRKLLVQRFHLAAHTATRDYPVLALTLDPKGPRITPSDPKFNLHGNIVARSDGSDLIYQFSGVTIAQFLYTMMNRFQGKQLVDETGLTGIYDITLRLPANAFQGGPATGSGTAEDELGPAFLAAAEKAGFKLVAKKGSLPVVIVDHIDPPTPN